MIDETEKQYWELVEALPIAALAIRDGCVIYANQECARIFGFSGPEEMIGLPALDLVAPESQHLGTERIKRFEEGQDNPTAEMELLRRDGSRFIAESTSVSILVEGERVGGIALRDITKIKESEKIFQERFRFQELISDISAKLINPSEDDFDQTIQDTLAEIAGYFEVDASQALPPFSTGRCSGAQELMAFSGPCSPEGNAGTPSKEISQLCRPLLKREVGCVQQVRR